MFLNRTASRILLALAGFSAGCKQMPPSATTQQVAARAVPTSTPAQVAAPQRETSLSNTPQAAQLAASPAEQPGVKDVEERKGPFTIKGQTFTVVQHLKLTGQKGAFDETLALLEIVDSGGVVHYRDDFPYAVEAGGFCPASVKVISGSNGAGFLLDMACAASQPDSGGPWQILSVANGKISPLGKPFSAAGQMGDDLIPGKINKIGNLTQILPDELRIRLFTGYFYVSVALRVGWWEGGLALAQHCFYQTGHGFAPDGCEMPVEDVERQPSEQELTFLRMFSESNARGIPEHIVVKKDSQVEILAGKVFVTLEESKSGISLGVGPDIWAKVRIDGKEGWIHTEEDLQAVGLYLR